MTKVIIYSDGSCINNGKKDAIGGIGIYNETECKYLQKKIVYSTFNMPVTNNICELYAIKVAINLYAREDNELLIISDSLYCINVFTKWASSWEKNNWRKAGNKEILNLELIKNIYESYKKYKISFKHVNSHTEEPKDKHSKEYKLWYGNYIADMLASNAMKRLK